MSKEHLNILHITNLRYNGMLYLIPRLTPAVIGLQIATDHLSGGVCGYINKAFEPSTAREEILEDICLYTSGSKSGFLCTTPSTIIHEHVGTHEELCDALLEVFQKRIEMLNTLIQKYEQAN